MGDDVLTLLLRRLLSAANGVRRRLSHDLSAALADIGDRSPSAEHVQTVREVLRRFAPDMTRLAAESMAASWLVGAGRASSWLPKDFRPTRLPDWWRTEGALDDWGWRGSRGLAPIVREAVRDLQAKELVTRPEYDRLTQAAKRRAFTVAGLADARALEKARAVLARAVDEGLTLPQAKRAVRDAAVAEAVNENVFRTNIERAYSVGMDKVLDIPQVAELFPFEETLPIRDSRLSELCEVVAKSGIQGTAIFYRADPVWRRYKPPRRWQCRCGRRALSVKDAAKRGIEYAKEWLRTGKQPWPLPLVPEPAVPLPAGWVPHDAGGDPVQLSHEGQWNAAKHPRREDGRFGVGAKAESENVASAEPVTRPEGGWPYRPRLKPPKNGEPWTGILHHGSAMTFRGNTLLPAVSGQNMTDAGNMGSGVYLTPHDDIANFYAHRKKDGTVSIRLSLRKPLVLSGNKNEEAQRQAKELGVRAVPAYDGSKQTNPNWSEEFTRRAMEAGYDGCIWEKNGAVEEVVSFKPVPFRLSNPVQFSWDATKHPRAKDGKFGTGTITKTTPEQRESAEKKRSRVGIHKGQAKEKVKAVASKKTAAVKAFLEGARFTIGEVKQLMGRWVKKGLKRLDPESRRAILRTAKLALAVEEKLEDGVKAAQDMVREVARSQGIGEENVNRVARLVVIADGFARWTVNVPLVHEAVHAVAHAAGPAGLAVAKLGWYLPLGSLVYLAGSLATNPLATIKAAKRALAERKGGEHDRKFAHAAKRFVQMALELGDDGREVVAELLRRFAEADDPDRQEALLCAALDAVKGDLVKALAMTESLE